MVRFIGLHVLYSCCVWPEKHNKQVHNSGFLSREKSFANFAFLWQFVKVFSVKIYFQAIRYRASGRGVLGYRKLVKVFFSKIYFQAIRESFLPRKKPTIRYCAALYCDMLYCTVLHCTVLHCTVLHCTALHCTALYCTVLYCTVLYCTVLCCTTLYCAVLHCAVLYCTVLYNTLFHLTSSREPCGGF